MTKKKKSGGIVPFTPTERKEKTLLAEVERLRSTLHPEEYLRWCRRKCGQSGGLEFSSVRAVVWKDLLLGVGPSARGSNVPYATTLRPPPNCHEQVMDCDIKRSLWHQFPNDLAREAKRQELRGILIRCLSHRPSFHYYQGLHEVIGFVMFVVGSYVPLDTVVAMCDALIERHLSVYCHKDMKGSESVLFGAHFVLKQNRPELAELLERLGLGPETHYALPWLITWFTHILADHSPQVTARIFDVLLCGCDNSDACFGGASSESAPEMTVPKKGPTSRLAGTNGVVAAVRKGARAAIWTALHLPDSGAAIGPTANHDSRIAPLMPCQSTMAGIVCASLLITNSDRILEEANREILLADGDTMTSFGKVFALISGIPRSMAEDNDALELCMRTAIVLSSDGAEGKFSSKSRRLLLEKQKEFCDVNKLNDVSLTVSGELSLVRLVDKSTFVVSRRVLQVVTTATVIAALAMTNWYTMNTL